jgi:hypothetical protein
MKILANTSTLLPNIVLCTLGFLFGRRRIFDCIYYTLPFVALIAGILFCFSFKVMQTSLGRLGIFTLIIYGIIILALRIKNFLGCQ